MRTKLISFFAVLWICTAISVQAQSYEKLWKNVEIMVNKDRPKSALEIAQTIFEKARREKNVSEMMKAYLAEMEYREKITPDSLAADIEGLERWVTETKEPLDAAVLHSILGSAYLDYLGSLSYNKWASTPTVNVPEEMTEWGGNIFVQKIFDHFRLSLRNKELLARTNVEAFKSIVEKGEAGKYFHHDMLHLLGGRAASALTSLQVRAANYYPQSNLRISQKYKSIAGFLKQEINMASEYDCVGEVLKIYQLMLGYYVSKNEIPAIVLVDLDRVKFMNNQSSNGNSISPKQKLDSIPYYNYLAEMTVRYASTNVCAEVYNEMAEFALLSGRPAQALELARQGIRKYPSYDRINMLKRIESNVLQPILSMRMVTKAYPEKPFQLQVEYRNLTGFTFKANRAAIASGRPLQLVRHFDLKSTPDYLSTDTTLQITLPEIGNWNIEIIADTKGVKSGKKSIAVTKLMVAQQSLPDNKFRFVVLDAQSGYPVPQAEILFYKGWEEKDNKLVKTLTTNQEGIVICEGNDWFNQYCARKGNDNAMPLIRNGYNQYNVSREPKKVNDLRLFTDRSIYRPGQTVYVSGIAYQIENEYASTLAGETYKLQLYDANWKVIAEKEVKTDDFGSFAGEFILPSPALTGQFSLRAGNSRAWFKVEEYKRPNFDVTFLPVEGTYGFGDSIWVTGLAKAFSGAPVQNAQVKYTVNSVTPVLWRVPVEQETIATGTVETDEKGEFRIRVYLKPKEELMKRPYYYYNYKVEATVTDGTGETEQGSLNLPLGNVSLMLSSDIPQEMQKEGTDSITIHTSNLSGQPVNTTVQLEVFERSKLNSERFNLNNNLAVSNNWSIPGNSLLKEQIPSNRAFDPTAIRRLPSGAYRLVLIAKDAQRKEVKEERDFVLFSLRDTRPPYQTSEWFKVINSEFSQDKPGILLFGTSEKGVYVFYNVFAGNECLESKQFQLTDSVMKFDYSYKEEYEGALLVQFAFAKDGKFYQESTLFNRAQPDKKLVMKWESFRDKLRPGQKEEWKLSITYPDGKPAAAQLLATLYDTSLDRLSSHEWAFGIYFPRSYINSYWYVPYLRNIYMALNFPTKQWNYKPLEYDELILPFSNYIGGYGLLPLGYTRGYPRYLAGSAKRNIAADREVQEAGLEESAVLVETQVQKTSDTVESVPDNVQLRENFAETAFFYPQLRTNDKGEITLSFTLPESLTEWKFMGLAHTREMDYGELQGKATASKDFMVSPNLPRFVRVGDETSISANIINLSGKNVAGTVRMELFDPETEKIFVTCKQKFSVKAGETQVATFAFTVSDKYSLLACRIIADGGSFSDGEQRLIPVLTDKVWITESVPMAVNGKETREFSLAGLFNHDSKTATDRRLTLEFTGNPAWYAVQALPSLSNPQEQNAISLASAYYANSIASYIVQANPRIRAVFESWKQQGGTKETLWSNLQKNQDLKNILLEESPWLMEATNEAEQKQRISALFDLNTVEYNNTIALDKLKNLQLPDGAWAWCKGMTGNSYVTTFVVEAFCRIPLLTNEPLSGEALQMQKKAWEYLHQEALAVYNNMKKTGKKHLANQTLPEQIIKYLYLCALSDQSVPAANKEAYSYYINRVAETLSQQDVYEKALSAIILVKAGRKAQANDFIVSLKEYAVQTPDMGMYYDTKTAPYSPAGYRIPTQVAVLEAMQTVAGDSRTVEQMKIWLLKQKQAQVWNSPIATVNAIYALLDRGIDLLANRGDVRIILGNKVFETTSLVNTFGSEVRDVTVSENVSGLGYIKETFIGKEITPAMKTITVEKRDAGIAWGAVYAQYLENMDAVTKAEGPLSVSKKLYVERMVGNYAQLVPLAEAGEINVGDKVVARITIQSDRDMDFVQLKDQRAACLEPLFMLSGYRSDNGLNYYLAIKDASTEFFFDHLRKGSYIVGHSFYVTRPGKYTGGIATLQSAYAPEFSAHSASEEVKVKEEENKRK